MNREYFSTPNLISYSRIVLAALLPFVFDNMYLVLLVVAAAAMSDIVDGYLARRTNVTELGAIIDPLCDKIFIAAFIATLIFKEHIPLQLVPLILLREIALIVGFLIYRKAIAKNKKLLKARWPGKAVTVLQFLVVGWAYFHLPHISEITIFVALASIVAVVDYFIIFGDK
jgi:cardiolipin synthase